MRSEKCRGAFGMPRRLVEALVGRVRGELGCNLYSFRTATTENIAEKEQIRKQRINEPTTELASVNRHALLKKFCH